MPMSTASIDSGFFGCSSQKKDTDYYGAVVVSKSPLSMTDEEELSMSSCGASTTSSFNSFESSRTSSASPPQANSAFGIPSRSRRNRARRSNRKNKRSGSITNFLDSKSFDGSSPTTPSSSSCCGSLAGSSSSIFPMLRKNIKTDQLAIRVYIYFKSLLMAVNRQISVCEHIGMIMRDVDARWGYSADRSRHKKFHDPRGCLAPIYSDGEARSGKQLVRPAKFPACWAVPQPAVYYSLMANDIREYMRFLERFLPANKFQLPSNMDPPISTHEEALASVQLMTGAAAQSVVQNAQQAMHYSVGGGMQQFAASSSGRNCSFVNNQSSVTSDRQEAHRRGSSSSVCDKNTTVLNTDVSDSNEAPKVILPPENDRQSCVSSSNVDENAEKSEESNSAFLSKNHVHMVPSILKSRNTTETTLKSDKNLRKYSCSTQSSSSASLGRSSTSSCSKMNPMNFFSDFDVDENEETENDNCEEEEEDYDDDGDDYDDSEEEYDDDDEDDEEDEETDENGHGEEDFDNLCFGKCCRKQNSPTIRKEQSIEPLTDAEYDYIERAHKDSKLLELYADLNWRFQCRRKTDFILPLIDMPHGLKGPLQKWILPLSTSPKANKESDGKELCQNADNCSISTEDDRTLAEGSPRNATNPPPVPDEIVSVKGEYQVSQMDVLSEKIWHYHNKVSQTDEMLSRKLHLRDRLYTAISPVFPMCGLYVVGSSLNGFGNNASDMDLCLMITNKELDQKNDAVVVLNLILTTLQYEKFVTHQKLILAKVPILRIKFADPFGDITVDLNANNSVAIKNTHLLCYYSSYDWRVRPLVSVVKEWAKRKGINDANKSSFTSYSLVLMVIHYLQCGTTPTVLPNLQKMYPDRFSNKCDVRLLNVTMPLNNPTGPYEPHGEGDATLGELLIGFLNYYANLFDYDRDAISIRQGQRLERAVVTRPKGINNGGNGNESPPSTSASCSSLSALPTNSLNHAMSNPSFPAWRSQWRCVCIEEPFTNSNTAHSIYDEMVFGAIKEAFREAHSELQQNHDLDRLMDCSPINVATAHPGASTVSAHYEGERPPAPPIPITIASQHHMNPIRQYQQHSPSKNSYKNGMNGGNHRGHQQHHRRHFTHNVRTSSSIENQRGGYRMMNSSSKECLTNVKDSDNVEKDNAKSCSADKENQKKPDVTSDEKQSEQ